jgi:hypothetical protein
MPRAEEGLREVAVGKDLPSISNSFLKKDSYLAPTNV